MRKLQQVPDFIFREFLTKLQLVPRSDNDSTRSVKTRDFSKKLSLNDVRLFTSLDLFRTSEILSAKLNKPSIMFLTFFNIGDQPKEYRSDVDILFCL